MRNPDRIDTVLAQIGRIWKQYPDLRLGQLLMNVFSDDIVLYYTEDDTLTNELNKYYKVEKENTYEQEN